MDFRLAEFPVVDGVEVRSFGHPDREPRSKRALRFVYKARPRGQQLPALGDFGFKVAGTMLVVDGECDEMLVPRVTRIEFDPDAEFITGRIERLTADRVAYVTGGVPWSRGYTYIPGEDIAARLVSEEFFLCEVMVLSEVEWAIELQRAKAAHDKFMGPDNPYRRITGDEHGEASRRQPGVDPSEGGPPDRPDSHLAAAPEARAVGG